MQSAANLGIAISIKDWHERCFLVGERLDMNNYLDSMHYFLRGYRAHDKFLAIRNLLGKNGIPSNPSWTENDIIRGIEEAIKQAREQGIEEGWNQAEAHYQIDKG